MALVKATYAVVALVVIEIVALLIAPAIYYTYFKDTANEGLLQRYPLSDSQIKASWANLPSAQQIWQAHYNQSNGLSYTTTSGVGSEIIFQNVTLTNIPNYHSGEITPRTYEIWVQYNSTIWFKVPQTYLANTANPPTIPKEDNFLGTNIPTTQGIIAVALITLTIVACSSCLLLNRKQIKTATLQS